MEKQTINWIIKGYWYTNNISVIFIFYEMKGVSLVINPHWFANSFLKRPWSELSDDVPVIIA